MASIHISFDCGCGFSTRSLEEAVQHSDALYHTLTVSGTVRSEKEPRGLDEVAKVYVRPAVSVGASFNELRAKLERR